MSVIKLVNPREVLDLFGDNTLSEEELKRLEGYTQPASEGGLAENEMEAADARSFLADLAGRACQKMTLHVARSPESDPSSNKVFLIYSDIGHPPKDGKNKLDFFPLTLTDGAQTLLCEKSSEWISRASGFISGFTSLPWGVAGAIDARAEASIGLFNVSAEADASYATTAGYDEHTVDSSKGMAEVAYEAPDLQAGLSGGRIPVSQKLGVANLSSLEGGAASLVLGPIQGNFVAGVALHPTRDPGTNRFTGSGHAETVYGGALELNTPYLEAQTYVLQLDNGEISQVLAGGEACLRFNPGEEHIARIGTVISLTPEGLLEGGVAGEWAFSAASFAVGYYYDNPLLILPQTHFLRQGPLQPMAENRLEGRATLSPLSPLHLSGGISVDPREAGSDLAARASAAVDFSLLGQVSQVSLEVYYMRYHRTRPEEQNASGDVIQFAQDADNEIGGGRISAAMTTQYGHYALALDLTHGQLVFPVEALDGTDLRPTFVARNIGNLRGFDLQAGYSSNQEQPFVMLTYTQFLDTGDNTDLEDLDSPRVTGLTVISSSQFPDQVALAGLTMGDRRSRILGYIKKMGTRGEASLSSPPSETPFEFEYRLADGTTEAGKVSHINMADNHECPFCHIAAKNSEDWEANYLSPGGQGYRAFRLISEMPKRFRTVVTDDGEACTGCHDPTDDGKLQITFVEEVLVYERSSTQSLIPTMHQIHITAGLACVGCHRVEGQERMTNANLPSAALCFTCHNDDLNVAENCLTCHLPHAEGLLGALGDPLVPVYNSDHRVIREIAHFIMSNGRRGFPHGDGTAEGERRVAIVQFYASACLTCHTHRDDDSQCSPCHTKGQKPLANVSYHGPFNPQTHTFGMRLGAPSVADIGHPRALPTEEKRKNCTGCHDTDNLLKRSARIEECLICHGGKGSHGTAFYDLSSGQHHSAADPASCVSLGCHGSRDTEEDFAVKKEPHGIDGNCTTCH